MGKHRTSKQRQIHGGDKVNYQPKKPSVARGKHGKQLEMLVDRTNIQYFNKGTADIKKVPTPTTVFKYDSRTGRIRDGVYTKGEWVDYVGLAGNGRAVAFDAKETKIKTSFPLMDNLGVHQYDFLKSWHDKGAYTFLLICFVDLEYETYVVPFKMIQEYYEGALKGGRKSIPYKEIAANCLRVKSENGVILHYLKEVF